MKIFLDTHNNEFRFRIMSILNEFAVSVRKTFLYWEKYLSSNCLITYRTNKLVTELNHEDTKASTTVQITTLNANTGIGRYEHLLFVWVMLCSTVHATPQNVAIHYHSLLDSRLRLDSNRDLIMCCAAPCIRRVLF